MKKNQKPIILAALAVVLLGVGAFAFMPQLTAPKPVAEVKKPVPESNPGSGNPADHPVTEAPGKPEASEANKPPVAVDPAQSDGTANDPAKAQVAGSAVPGGELSKLRDPFAKPSNVSGINPGLAATAPAPANPSTGAPAEGAPVATKAPRPGSGSQPWLQPLNPVGGSLPAAGSQPLPMGGVASAAGVSAAQPRGPRYKLKGVLQGRVPVAVLEDAEGNQRIVRIGEMCDAGTKVTGISSGQVTLVEKGKEKTLVIEEQAG